MIPVRTVPVAGAVLEHDGAESPHNTKPAALPIAIYRRTAGPKYRRALYASALQLCG